MDKKSRIKAIIEESIEAKQQVLASSLIQNQLEELVNIICEAFLKDKKVLIAGNGGSAADAQHFSSELSGRFYHNRKALFAEALHVNTSFVTAVANDYGFEEVYARMIEAAGREGDVFVAISTSGNSKNILNAMKKAKQNQMIVVSWLGDFEGKMIENSDLVMNAPSRNTPRIQEVHELWMHIVCELVEKELLDNGLIKIDSK